MNEKINQILQELYKYDSEFMKHEKELESILSQMLKNSPNTKFDPAFAENLRKKVLIKAEQMSSLNQHQAAGWFSFKLFAPALAVVAIAIFAGVNYWQKQNNTYQLASKENTKLEPLAFGSLSETILAGYGRGGGGGGAGLSELSAISAAAPVNTDEKRSQSGGGSSELSILPYYDNYKFVYSGEALELADENLDVLKRQKGFDKTFSLDSLLKNFSVPSFNIKSLQNAYLDSFTLTEDREFGYMVNVSLREGSVNVNENWFRWQTPDRLCQDEACFNQYRLKLSDMPSDSEIIAISEAFLTQYGVKKDNYGSPVLQKQWFRDYQMAQDKSMAWIPDIVNVVYPLQVNGQTVYDESGNPSGLNVSVNVRLKKASGFYDLTNQTYQSSAYPAETSVERILKVAEAGGNQMYYPFYDGNANTVEVKLGTPVRSMMRMWKNEIGAESYEILVPALVFPIIDAPANFPSYRSAVTVPLIKELIKDPTTIQPGQPMPLSEPRG